MLTSVGFMNAENSDEVNFGQMMYAWRVSFIKEPLRQRKKMFRKNKILFKMSRNFVDVISITFHFYIDQKLNSL